LLVGNFYVPGQATLGDGNKGLLTRWRAQAMPGIANLVVVHLGHIVRRVEAERLDVEAAGGAEQRIGCTHTIPLRADEPRAGGREILLRVEDVERRSLARLCLLLHAAERDVGRAHLLPRRRAQPSPPRA
jgi:hypothetical protein